MVLTPFAAYFALSYGWQDFSGSNLGLKPGWITHVEAGAGQRLQLYASLGMATHGVSDDFYEGMTAVVADTRFTDVGVGGRLPWELADGLLRLTPHVVAGTAFANAPVPKASYSDLSGYSGGDVWHRNEVGVWVDGGLDLGVQLLGRTQNQGREGDELVLFAGATLGFMTIHGVEATEEVHLGVSAALR